MRVDSMVFSFLLEISRKALNVTLPLSMLLIFSCERPEGPGGKGTIRGQVMERSYDQGFRVLQSVNPAADEDVYISYGEELRVSDDRNTSPEGRFEFKYLSKGDYTVFLYSDDTTGSSPDGKMLVEIPVRLSSNSDEKDLGTINIYRAMDFDDGQATIFGKVWQVIWSLDFIYPVDTIPAQNQDVFLIYEDDLHYADRIRTLQDGSFAFPNLIKGNYRILVYSDDQTGGAARVPVVADVTVDALQGVFQAGELYTAKED